MKKADTKKDRFLAHRGISNLRSHQSVTLDLKIHHMFLLYKAKRINIIDSLIYVVLC